MLNATAVMAVSILRAFSTFLSFATWGFSRRGVADKLAGSVALLPVESFARWAFGKKGSGADEMPMKPR
jgi:hypothetical protein